jgi:hypothetical protein
MHDAGGRSRSAAQTSRHDTGVRASLAIQQRNLEAGLSDVPETQRAQRGTHHGAGLSGREERQLWRQPLKVGEPMIAFARLVVCEEVNPPGESCSQADTAHSTR